MVSLYTGPISRTSLIDSVTLLPLSSYSTRLSLLPSRKTCGSLKVKPKKKKDWVLRMCNKRSNFGWDSDGTKDLETEILEFMKGSDKPGMFPSKKDLIRCERFDLVERIVKEGGWLSMGWDLDEQEEDCNAQETDKILSLDAIHLSSRDDVDGRSVSGIEGILTRLEKERNSSLGISLTEKGESNGSVPRSSMVVKTASEVQEAKSVSGTSETWRTWSMRRAGFTDEDFEAAEISASGGKKDSTNKGSSDSVNGKDKTASSREEINTTHIKSRLRNLQSELSSVLNTLRSQPDEVVTSKDSERDSGNLEILNDDWEYKENEIMYAQNKLRSTRAKLAVLEGKMAMAIIDAQRIVREKQRKIDHASRALRLLRTAPIVWPNSASEVLLTGSFDGWSTQRKMKRAENGVFSLSLKLYPGKYEIKFVVDGQWKVDPLRPIVTGNGYENNLLIVS